LRKACGRACGVIAIALHTVLWAAVTPLTAAPAIDLFAVIGLSETSPPAEQHRSMAHLRRRTRATTAISLAELAIRPVRGIVAPEIPLDIPIVIER